MKFLHYFKEFFLKFIRVCNSLSAVIIFQLFIAFDFKWLRSVSGQKGIGFKSVFRVTDCPEVHSNGFHIKFDVNSGPMGYILPHWVEQDPSKNNDKYVASS